MRNYILKRLLLFIPTLIAISLLAFVISINAPGDPVERMLVSSHEGGEQGLSNIQFNKEKKALRKKLGLDLPVFYFTISDLATPDTFYKIEDKGEREMLARLLAHSGNWESLSEYYNALLKFESHLLTLSIETENDQNRNLTETKKALSDLRIATFQLRSAFKKETIEFLFQVIETNITFLKLSEELGAVFNQLKNQYIRANENFSRWKNYLPAIHFYANNQYHRWLFGDVNELTGRYSTHSKGILRGDFGTSYASKGPVSVKIWNRLYVSIFFTLLSVFFAYLISIPLATRAAAKPNSFFDKASSLLLFVLFSMPSFFLATLLLMIFANSDVLNWFPSSGLKPLTGIDPGVGLLERVQLMAPYIVLPLVCFTASSVAFLSRSIRSSLLQNLSLDYIRTARAKGLSENRVVYYHAFKNSLLPVITLFSNVFPFVVGGSVVIETIFTIPGMGLEMYNAIHNQDYPVIIAIFTLTGFMTLCGMLLADILYAFADPRISFSKTK